jgi:hypothetical protein
MRLSSSSIFSFDGLMMRRSPPLGYRRFRRDVLATVLSTIVSLVALDVAVDIVFGLPADPQAPATTMETYFDYGRSVEGKLRRMVAVDATHDAPIIEAGWLAHDCSRSETIPAGKIGIDMYGNSFSEYIGSFMEKIDPAISIEYFGGPGAPPSHSYACFVMRDEARKTTAPIQVIGVLGSSMRRMLTISGVTTTVEQPQPFTYPRYSIGPDGRLVAYSASIQSVDELRTALQERAKWRQFNDELATMDAFYAPEMMSENIADRSVLLRMMRRAWGQRVIRDRTASLHAETGFSGAPEIASVARAILKDFAKRARAAGQRPIVILIEDHGFGGLLSAVLSSTLKENHIEFIATGEFVRADDPYNFVPDGHFTPVMFLKIARAVLQLVDPGRADSELAQ